MTPPFMLYNLCSCSRPGLEPACLSLHLCLWQWASLPAAAQRMQTAGMCLFVALTSVHSHLLQLEKLNSSL